SVPVPTQSHIDIVRFTWERITEVRHPSDDSTMSPAHAFGVAFYDALFDLDPQLVYVFSNVCQQARALTGMISYMARVPAIATEELNVLTHDHPVSSIKDINADRRAREDPAINKSSLPDIVRAITANSSSMKSAPKLSADEKWIQCKFRELGERHLQYNVQPHQLSVLGPAILIALKKRLKHEYVPEVEEAWFVVQTYAIHHMRIGMISCKAEQGKKSRGGMTALGRLTTAFANDKREPHCNIQ
ncbi:uncharacterized protein BYT42DRAFT_506373, partial [Radiomyces spectabilis]|uniref:uncharacterized protein n=1 Tax=Radiomyces spectabilis TaxID=64574 RepID=UPI00221EF8CE